VRLLSYSHWCVYAPSPLSLSRSVCLSVCLSNSLLCRSLWQAIKLYTQLGKASVDNALTRWSVKEYFFKAGLCHLCNEDLEGARRALEQFDNLDSTFGSSREGVFLKVRN
jgi:hypothetical protein